VPGIETATSERLKNAEDRLARAIGRLQAALEAKADDAAPASADPSLAGELSRLQTENTELRTLVGQASERIDAAIGKLKSRMAG